MRTATAATVLAVLAGVVSAQANRPAGPTNRANVATGEPALLAAESFRHSAVEMTCSSSDTPARAGRLVALCRFADRLAPGDWRTSRLLADIYLARGGSDLEAAALESYLASFPADHARRLRWMAARLQQVQTADGRAELLVSLVAREDLPAVARAEAAAMLARLRHAQGRIDDANSAARRALELDPYGPSGLAMWAALEGKSAAAGQVETLFRLLRGDPRASETAWRLGLELAALGLHREGLQFLDHARSSEPDKQKIESLPQSMLVQYCNALLDVGENDRAVEILEPAASRYSRSADVNSLLVEAYRAAGKADKAEKLVDAMSASYKTRQTGGEVSEAFAAELAWFHVVTQPRPALAIIYAQRVAQADANSPVRQRILGAAELASGRTSLGEERLRKLLGKDTYASVFLAERYAGMGKPDPCRQALLAAAPLPRSGPAWRRLKVLATERSIVLPDAPGRQRAAELAQGFDQTYLEMLLKPEGYLSVTLKPARGSVACGEPLTVVVSVRNDGASDIPIGDHGLFRPEVALYVAVAEGGKRIGSFSNVPLAIWPAPRYLRPGEDLACETRLDVADLAAALAQRPLADLTVDVAGILGPTPKGGGSLPSVRIAPARMVRASLLGAFDTSSPAAWADAYRLLLGRIVADLKRGPTARRMLAARQTASLLAFARLVELRQAEAPAPLADSIDKLVLLSMTRALLQDPSPAVRQEMIASLRHAPLDEIAISLLAPAINDADPMVRLRLVELLAAARTRGYRTIVDLLVRDDDQLVRAMAEAFQKP